MWHIVWSFRGILQIRGFVDETRKIKQKTGGFAKHYRSHIWRYDYKHSSTCGNIVVQEFGGAGFFCACDWNGVQFERYGKALFS